MGKDANLSNSGNDVITTASHVLYAFEGIVEAEMPNIPIVYTQELDFESALKEVVGDENYQNGDTSKAVPFFAYNRTILKEIDDRHLGKRAKGKTGCVRVGDENIGYGVAYGEFDIQFMYASNNVQLQEQFEVVYNSDEGISGSKELIVDLEALGSFNYYLDYQELSDMTINFQDTYYKLIVGSVKVRGFYFTFRGSSAIIKEINQTIYSTLNLDNKGDSEVLSTTQIT